MPELTTDIRYIKGIGEQRAKLLKKLNIFTLQDLISYFPRDYDDRRTIRKIAALTEGETVCVQGVVSAPPVVNRIRNDRQLVKLRVVDETRGLDIVFFHQVYMCDKLHEGKTYFFFGKVEGTAWRKSMINPIVETEDCRSLTGRIVPLYPLTAGVSQAFLAKTVAQGLTACRTLLPDAIPDEIRRAYDVCHVNFAYERIHFPENNQELAIARRRFVFEELFLLTIGLRKLRTHRETRTCRPFADTELSDFYQALPFSLTTAQRNAICDIVQDLCADRPMNRLVQGDVGSGKTMVAAAAMVCAARSGRQSALMVPTELLAQQHYHGLAPLLERLGISCTLLTGALPAKTRRRVLAALEKGETCVVIGTHALISPEVRYHDLGLVITDEQHRFGVDQRAALSAKGDNPHLLVMSATPIPRTLALMIYGDLDVSIMDELPPNRQPVDTFFVTGAYRARFYQFLRKEIAAGRQAYIICSRVEQEDNEERKAVTEYTQFLQTSVFPDLRVACVHGRMKPKEKDAVMSAFSAGESDILVSTTVVEVGVDVPNATVILIEDADRFGLSQLHQLRGRVGRGEHKSYCILVSDNKNEETRQRLRVMTKTTDGFQIAEEDLRLRGPGDFFGARQHGLPALKVADLSCDMAVLKQAQSAAEELLRRDPDLNAHPVTAQRIAELFQIHAETMN